MKYLFAGMTDIGISKKTNQDSYCYREAETPVGNVVMAVLCDGMGGLAKGELASKSVINAFEVWFDYELSGILSSPRLIEEIQYQWERLIKIQNASIGEYGKANYISLGSTATAIIVLPGGEYIIAHVGDSRVYRITADNCEILTQDQTLVAREIRMGRLAPEAAETDPRRSVLLQCVGASRDVVPDFIVGRAGENECFMLCSDGFRHKISQDEIAVVLNPTVCGDEEEMESRIENLIHMDKLRRETDNITAIMVKTV